MSIRPAVLLTTALCLGIAPSQLGAQAQKAGYTLGFSTYLAHTDRFFAAFDVVTDDKGYVYVSGNTADRNFPTTEGAFQRELKGEADAFVVKFAPDGKLVFSTLIGGSKREHHTGVTVGRDGAVYLVGGTHSPDFPVSQGAYDTSFNGEGEWAGDVYVLGLDPSGRHVVFATYLGGKAEDTAHSIAIDSKGNVLIAGITCSEDFPATDGVIDRNYHGKQNSFVAKFSPDGRKLLFSTSLGHGVDDTATGLTTDNTDNIYVTGRTAAADLPVTGNAIRKHLSKPDVESYENGMDHFVAKINESGTKLLYSSYFADGGWGGTNITWASPNRLVVSGSTRARNFPVTDNALSRRSKGGRDAFLSIFDSDDMSLRYSTLLGGSELDTIAGAYLLDDDRVVVGGMTNSADFPLTGDAIDSAYPGSDKLFNSSFLGRRKAFVSVVDIKKGQVAYSTYFGACLRFDVFPDRKGNLGFVAETGPHGFPGVTEFPLSDDAFRVPPTDLMLGRLVLSGASAKR